MSVVLRLDVPALERLIGGDTEIELQLRHGVVEEFAKRHLVHLLKEETFQGFMHEARAASKHALQEALQQAVGDVKKNSWGGIEHVELREALKAKLAEEVERRITEVVKKEADESWARREQRLQAEVFRAVQAKVDILTEKVVRELVQARLDKIKGALDQAKSGL